jgi:hypothetical protein
MPPVAPKMTIAPDIPDFPSGSALGRPYVAVLLARFTAPGAKWMLAKWMFTKQSLNDDACGLVQTGFARLGPQTALRRGGSWQRRWPPCSAALHRRAWSVGAEGCIGAAMGISSEGLDELRDDLGKRGQPLVIRVGEAADLFEKLQRKHGITGALVA